MSKIPTFGKVEKGIKYVERPGAYGFIGGDAGELAIVQTTFGFFLPGGGIENDEDPTEALRREISEEIGFTLIEAKFFAKAAQFHWSEFYKQNFKKVGHFYLVEASPPSTRHHLAEHDLLWWPPEMAAKRLSQEFQRWAVTSALQAGIV